MGYVIRRMFLGRCRQTMKVLAFALLATTVGYFPVRAQVAYDTATLKGIIYDPKGAVVPGATITVTDPTTSFSKTVKSETDGSYHVAALRPGTYDVTVDAAGFSKAVAKDIVLTVGQAVPYDVHLAVGGVNEVVEVTGQPPLVDPQQSQQANTINARQVENLPNINRSFTQSIYTVPGVVYSYGPTVQDATVGTGYLASGFSVGGSNGRNNLVTIDGGENDYGSGALRATNVPADSVQEIQVNRNSFQAEFGYTVGTAINMVTKSGTNKFHGSGYTYFHDQVTDAANYSNRFSATPGSKPFEQSSISGVTLGGPIKKDKVFFFGSYEHQKLDWPTVVNYAAQLEFTGVNPAFPGATAGQVAYLQGLAASGIPGTAQAAAHLAANLNPLNTTTSAFAHSATLLQTLLAQDSGTFDGLSNELGAERGIPGFNTPRGRYHNAVARFDFLPSAKDNLFLRFYYLHETDNVAPQPPTSEFDRFNSFQVTGAWNRVISPTIVNTLRVQVVPHDGRLNATPLPNHSEVDLGSQIFLGNPFAFPYDANQRRFQFDDSISWVKGTHDLKFGVSYRPLYYNVFEQLWFGGQWKFADGAFPILFGGATPADENAINIYNFVAFGLPTAQAGGPASASLTAAQSYVAGRPTSLLQANPNSNARWASWDHYLGLYAQDSWRATPKLTLNYGVRLDYDAAASPVPHSTHVSPRLGIAWDPVGNGKTVVRAGGGIFVAPAIFLVPFYVNSLGDSGKYINWAVLPYLPPPFVNGGPIVPLWAATQAAATPANPNPAPGFGATVAPPGPTTFGSVFTTLGPNFKPEYSIQASLSIAREIAPNLSLEVGYTMYHSVHIEQSVESNFARASCPVGATDVYGGVVNAQGIDPFIGPCYASKPGTTAGEPNANIFGNYAFSSVGNGIYHGLTTSLTKRYGHNLQFQVNYTFSRAIDNTSDYSTLTTPYRPGLLAADRSASDFNVTHNFVASAVYNFPYHAGGSFLSRVLSDVTIAPIVSARSGFPFTLLVPGLANGFPTGNGTLADTHPRPYHEGRNAGIGPGFASWDMRVSKSLYIKRDSGVKLDVIAQGQNLLNRTNFASVNDNFPADPNFVLPNGGTLLNGPYNVQGFRPTSTSQLSQPLAFTQAYPSRQVSFGLQFSF